MVVILLSSSQQVTQVSRYGVKTVTLTNVVGILKSTFQDRVLKKLRILTTLELLSFETK